SKPRIATPLRDVWPFCPLPLVLPVPDAMPRPIRLRGRRAPSLSTISFSFIVYSPVPGPCRKTRTQFRWSGSAGLIDADQVPYLVDHAAYGGRILQLTRAVQPVQSQPDQGPPLVVLAADRTPDLRHPDGPVSHCFNPSLPRRRYAAQGYPIPSGRGGRQRCAATAAVAGQRTSPSPCCADSACQSISPRHPARRVLRTRRASARPQ